MKVKINKTTGDYTADDCSVINSECAGMWCSKDNPPIKQCVKCQCFYCTKGNCIERNQDGK